MRSSRLVAAVGFAGCVAGFATTAHAQDATLQVRIVQASDGKPVAGASVVVRNPAIGLDRRQTTDDSGVIRLDGAATSGSYIISTERSDRFAAAQSAPIALRSGFTRSVTLSLVPAPEAADIVVTGSRAVTGVNQTNAEVSASLPREALVALPIEGRDVQSALVRLPNVVPSTGFFPEAPAVSINGANGLFTNYLIDGLDNNENFLGGLKFPVPLGFTQDVTLLANSYSARYGRTANGIVNYTTPSGSNNFHGEALTLIRPGRPLDATSPFAGRDLSGNPVGSSFERYQAGASLGGPIVRDKTFFYANLEYTRDHNENVLDAPALGTVANVVGNNKFVLGSLRLDHYFTDDLHLSLRGNIGRVTIDRPGGSLGGGNVTFPSAGSLQDRNSTLLAGSLSYAGDAWSYDGALQYSRFHWNYARAKGAPGPQVTAQDQTGLPIAVVGNPGYVFDEIENSWQVTNRLRRRFGHHRITVGADVILSDFSLAGGGNPDGNYTIELTPAQIATLRARNLGTALGASYILSLNPRVLDYSVELRPQTFGTTQVLPALYIEDEWDLSPKLTATIGLRWDYDSLTEKATGRGDYNNIAPRLALNYHPDSRSAFRLGGGLFYGKLSYTVISDALQRNTTSSALIGQLRQLQSKGIIPASASLDRVTFDGNLTVSPACTTANACPSPAAVQGLRDTALINEVRILNPKGYQSPYSLQLSAGYQYQATDTLTLGVDLIYSRSYNLVRLRDLNAPAPFTPNLAALTDANIALLRAQSDNSARMALAESLELVRSQVAADASRPVELVPGGGRQITVSETAGSSLYRALNIQINKVKGEDDYAFRFSYTLSKLSNDTDDLNFRASDANIFAADYGASANDRRHVISAVGFLYPLKGLTLTVAGLFQSGQPINYVPDASIFGTQDLNGDGQSFGANYVGNSDRYPGIGRNTGRLPWSSTVDVGIRYDLPLLGRAIELSADVFNVLNTNNQSGFANAATTSNQIQFGGGAPFVQRNAGPPRQFQFGATWKF
jgi:hypothetical protein